MSDPLEEVFADHDKSLGLDIDKVGSQLRKVRGKIEKTPVNEERKRKGLLGSFLRCRE